MTVYGYPDVGRFGLGHSLLAWARCAVWCEENGATMLGPIWLRPRIGPYLRRERDKREYFKLFTNAPYPSRLKRTWLLAAAKTIPIEELTHDERPPDGSVVVFSNCYARNFETHFHKVANHGDFLRSALLGMTKSAYLPKHPPSEPFVAIHVRLGDFKPYDESAATERLHNLRLPMDWYVEALIALRNELGFEIKARVYSDGSDRDIVNLLSQRGVVRAVEGPSITHLLEMTQATAMIASGSGFSFWSAFLGDVPRIVFPGQGFDDVQVHVPTLVWPTGNGSMPKTFISSIETKTRKVNRNNSRVAGFGG